jgi:serine phosphatase RsbU (regulator of sigma subunit)
MGVARQTIRVAGMNETRPSAILFVLNEALIQGRYERFVTVCDVRARPGPDATRLTVCAAGHPLPLLIRGGGSVESVGVHGMVLGVLDEVALTDATADMGPGDALVLYTDGLVEWPSHADVDLRPLLSTLAGRTAREIVQAIEAWWRRGTGGAGRDDAAVLVLRSVPPDEDEPATP